MVYTHNVTFKTPGDGTIVDLSAQLAEAIAKSGTTAGMITVCTTGSTAAITTMEFEPGLKKDIPELMEKLVPRQGYHHDATWGDGNGFSHLRSALIGTSFVVSFSGGQPHLGTWQQVVFLDFDNRPRERSVVVQVMGE
ncbi:MAG: YjbQ family protein [Planctomycetes bacterium]|nr:YjbQ family protein [Planctomycetota bacterium]